MFALLHALFALCFATAQASTTEDPFRVEVTDVTVAPGGSAKVGVTLYIPPSFHVYRDMVELTVTNAGSLTASAPVYPTGELAPDPSDPSQTREMYEDSVTVQVPVKASASATGKLPLQMRIRYQGCKTDLCYMPATQDLTALVTVGTKAGSRLPPFAGPALAGPVSGLALLTALASPAYAQDDDPNEQPVHFTAATGTPDHLTIHADLVGEWHINKMFLQVTLPDAPELQTGDLVAPPAKPSGSEADGSYREDYMEDFDFTAPLSGPAGKRTVKVDVGYQACKGVSLCRMPTVETISVPVELTGAALAAITTPAMAAPAPVAEAAPAPVAEPAPAPKAAPQASSDDSGFAAAQKQGIWALLLLCFGAGVAVSFTPCVLPMVPITLGIIGARSASSKLEAVGRAGIYVLGLASVYTIAGVVIGMTGGMFGSWLQSPWLVGGIALLFFVMGGGMFGIYEVGMPSAVTSRLQGGGGQGGGLLAPFITGAIGALVAGPCSGPVVVSILAVIGREGKVGEGAALMATFSLGMGMIFLVTGAASSLLPRRGAWMDVVKKSFGIILWLGAIYYASPQLPDTLTALLTAAVLLGTAVFAWPHPDDGEGYTLERLRQVYAITGGLVGAYLLVGTLLRVGLILPPMQVGSASAATSSTASIAWLSDEEAAVAQSKASGKPMIVDFTAEWCAACHEMERLTYTDAKVADAAKGFVTVMIDCTKDSDPRIKALQQKYGVVGLPKVVFVAPDGTIVDSTQGFVPPEEFLPKMQGALASAG